MRLIAAILIWSAGFAFCAVWLQTFWRDQSRVPAAVVAAPGLVAAALCVAIVVALLDGASLLGNWVRFVNVVLTLSLLSTGIALLVRRTRLRAL